MSAGPPMTDPQGDTPREFNPRHRIMGAVVLVSLAVIFVPMILEDRSAHEPVPEQAVAIPGKDSRLFVSKITPIENVASPEPGAATPATPEPAPAPGQAAGQEPKSAPPETKSATPPAPKEAPPPKPAPPAAQTAAKAETWAVRVGTFSQRENATRVANRLKAAGFDAKSERLNANGRKVTRVWLGPFATRDEAVKLQARILKQTGQEGFVVSYP